MADINDSAGSLLVVADSRSSHFQLNPDPVAIRFWRRSHVNRRDLIELPLPLEGLD